MWVFIVGTLNGCLIDIYATLLVQWTRGSRGPDMTLPVVRRMARRLGGDFTDAVWRHLFYFPLFEIIVGLVFYIDWHMHGELNGINFLYVGFLLAMSAVCNRTMVIPDHLTIPGMALGVVTSPLASHGVIGSIGGLLLGGGILFAVAWTYERSTGREGMGGGAIKMLAMVGAFVGWEGVLLTLLVASLSGSIVGVTIMIRERADARMGISFAEFLATGGIVTLLFGKEIVLWYRELVTTQ